MKVLLRDPHTRLYVAGPEPWTPDRGQARDFGSTFRALQHAVEHYLATAEFVYAFADPAFDLTSPVFSSSLRPGDVPQPVPSAPAPAAPHQKKASD